MARVTYDNRSFLVDGRRIWLSSGAMHYFRTPAALWRDRLTKALRGGLNCIETYVAWNVHEPTEGEWDFRGDRNVFEFIQQAGDLGLFVILRPGPYICAEWDFGGLPGWLAAKPNVQYRSTNATFAHYMDKYFRQVLPRAAELQVSRGGNIIAVQAENEYFMTTEPDRSEYLGSIVQQFRRAGLDVPILTCNWLSEPMVDGAVECINAWDGATTRAKQLRNMQPDKPMLATELWVGWYDRWGKPHERRDPRHAARRALEMIGAGAQLNQYMFHGGTNFEFWAGRSLDGPNGYVTTSYDYDAPVAEGGGLTRKYYLLRLVNLLARQCGSILADAAPMDAAAALEHTACYEVAGPRGHLTVVTNNGDDRISRTRVVLSNGRELDVDLSHFGAVALLHNAALNDNRVLDYSNLTPLGVFGDGALILHGVAGQDAVFCVDGKETNLAVPEKDEVERFDLDGLTALVMNSSLAERCWWVDGQLVIGPAFAGETLDDLQFDTGARAWFILDGQREWSHHKVAAGKSHSKPRPPKLSAWAEVTQCPEPTAPDKHFRRLDRVRDLAHLNVPYGYGWYRVTIEAARACKKALFLPQAGDRVHIFHHGRRMGIWGVGPGAVRRPMNLSLRRGPNELTFLADNLGRFNFGHVLGEPKGLWGGVYHAAVAACRAWKVAEGAEDDFSKRMLPRPLQYLAADLQQVAPKVCETSFTLPHPMHVHLAVEGLAPETTMILFCNDRLVRFLPAGQGGFGEVVLTNETVKGTNRLKLLVWPDIDARMLAKAVKLHRLEENLTHKSGWRFAPWQAPSAEALADSAQPDNTAAGASESRKHLPAWFRATFRAPSAETPLFINLAGAAKGQLFLNGRNLCRFWTLGPQEWYYLPECWLEKENELLVFSEDGSAPTDATLAFKPLGPCAE